MAEYTIIDRREESLGNPPHDRTKADITIFGWHYTATNNSFITNHENYWGNTLGWDRGGYMFYIDKDANIYQNYDYTQKTWGVANSNSWTAHVSVEAATKSDYTQAQVEARDWLTRKVMSDLNLSASQVQGHWEIYNNSVCPGYNTAEMNEFRRQLANGEPVDSGKVVQATDASTPSSSVGATLVKNEVADFTTNTKIKVRSAPSTNATHTGTLPADYTLTYDEVYKGNGYRWLAYTANSGNRRYVPYRPESKPNTSWGTFSEVGQAPSPENKQASNTGASLHLPASASRWNVYRPQGPYTTGNQIHKLTPSAYGGLTYEIQGNPAPHVYLIDTGVKGRVAIYAHPSTGATVS